MAEVSASAHSYHPHAIHGERLTFCSLCLRSVFLPVSLCLLPLLFPLPTSTCTLTRTPPSMWTAPRETPAAPLPNEEHCSLAMYIPPTDQAAADSQGSRTCVCPITFVPWGGTCRREGRINVLPWYRLVGVAKTSSETQRRKNRAAPRVSGRHVVRGPTGPTYPGMRPGNRQGW